MYYRNFLCIHIVKKVKNTKLHEVNKQMVKRKKFQRIASACNKKLRLYSIARQEN